jgi:hypothetical protein
MPALAQQVTFEGATWNLVGRATTLRVPATGTFTVRPVSGAYLAVGVGMSGVDYTVESVTWNGVGGSQRLAVVSSRTADYGGPGCRAEMWGLAGPAAGDGFATVVVSSFSAAPSPALGASLMEFGNVGDTSTDGPCCMFISNSGSADTTVTKTFDGTSRGDLLVDSLCITWSSADPGTPVPSLADNPVLVTRVVQSTRNLYILAGTSPGAAVDPPMTSYRHMRYVEGGTRDWALTGVILQPAAAPVDAAPPDAPAPADAPRTPDAAPADPPPDAPITPDAALDRAADVRPADAAPDPIDATGALSGDGALVRRRELRVGCACQLGARPPGPIPLLIPIGLALGIRGRSRAARASRARSR